MITDIAFKEYRKSSDIHGAVLYPAPMIAPVQKAVLSEYLTNENPKNIIDPFHGSGVALYEAAKISPCSNITGIDINPFANLISRAKLQGVDERIVRDLEIIKDKIYDRNFVFDSFSFLGVDKWFREDFQISLSKLRACIMSTKNPKSRLFFWCIFADIVRKYSNSRSSTYKLHIKEEQNISKMSDKILDDFIKHSNYYAEKFIDSPAMFYQLLKGDSIVFLRSFKDNCFDICVTSPPYGDNNTTVPYGQYSMLALNWIDKKDINLEGWEMETFSSIDSKSLGGGKSAVCELMVKSFDLENLLEKIDKRKHLKVTRFFAGYFTFLDELARTTKEAAILTLGNRTVDRINIDLTSITSNYLSNIGFNETKRITREIPSKRTPRITSMVNNEAVSSMNEEFVLIMEKKI